MAECDFMTLWVTSAIKLDSLKKTKAVYERKWAELESSCKKLCFRRHFSCITAVILHSQTKVLCKKWGEWQMQHLASLCKKKYVFPLCGRHVAVFVVGLTLLAQWEFLCLSDQNWLDFQDVLMFHCWVSESQTNYFLSRALQIWVKTLCAKSANKVIVLAK